MVLTMLAFLLSVRATQAQTPESLRQPIGFGPVSGFKLTDQNGNDFRPEDLRGTVWVAHFFFTTCLGGCAQTTESMRKLQETFRGHPHLKLVSISVNPENDSQELLRDYAKGMKAQEGQWYFLRGPEKQVHDIIQKHFYQSTMRNEEQKKGYEILHSFDLMLVDHEGNLVGRSDGRDATVQAALEERINELLRARQVALEPTTAPTAPEPARIWFPLVNASLNGLCGILLVLGYIAIRNRRERLHINCMVAALVVSAVFLSSYLYYHIAILKGQPTVFRGEGWVRVLYLAILLSHTVLAAVVAPLAIWVAVLGWKDRRPKHVKIARWTLPLWLYVSVTGVIVYVMLYQLYPPL